VHNIDRFLDGAATFWWQTNQAKYEEMLENGDAEDNVWKLVSNDMSLSFSKATQKEEARRKLRETRYSMEDDPLLYVTQRSRYFSLAEPHLDEKDKVNRLIEGLPE